MQKIYPGLPVLEQAIVVLASASPRRRELLSRLLPPDQFQIIAADIDESTRPTEKPSAYVLRMAQEKATKGLALAQHLGKPGQPLLVLGADTSVVLGDKIYGKPGTPANASQMLCEIAGQTHQVMTGIALQLLQTNGEISQASQVCVTDVEMRPLTTAEINWYVETGEPLDKAGAYAVQGFGGILVAAVRGDYYNVVGLPISSLVEMLGQVKIF